MHQPKKTGLNYYLQLEFKQFNINYLKKAAHKKSRKRKSSFSLSYLVFAIVALLAGGYYYFFYQAENPEIYEASVESKYNYTLIKEWNFDQVSADNNGWDLFNPPLAHQGGGYGKATIDNGYLVINGKLNPFKGTQNLLDMTALLKADVNIPLLKANEGIAIEIELSSVRPGVTGPTDVPMTAELRTKPWTGEAFLEKTITAQANQAGVYEFLFHPDEFKGKTYKTIPAIKIIFASDNSALEDVKINYIRLAKITLPTPTPLLTPSPRSSAAPKTTPIPSPVATPTKMVITGKILYRPLNSPYGYSFLTDDKKTYYLKLERSVDFKAFKKYVNKRVELIGKVKGKGGKPTRDYFVITSLKVL